jgi:LPXTG-motif cell wall-anchored protein
MRREEKTMRKLAVFVALALLACGVAVAQQDMGNSPTAGATFVTGTIDSSTSDSLVLRLDSGDRFTLLLNDQTVGVMARPTGTRLKVNYHVNDRGQAIADEIQGLAAKEASAPIAPAPSSVKVHSEPVASVPPAPPAPAIEERPAPTPPPIAATAPPAPASETDLSASSPRASENLPKTASSEPLLLLLGLMAVASGVAFRFFR